MRNPKHLARLYDALQKGDEEEEGWQADGDGSAARAVGPTVNEDEGAGLIRSRGASPARGNHTVILPRAGRRS